MTIAPLVHSAAALVQVPAPAAFDFMADPVALGRWSLGCMDTRPTGDGAIHTGHSLFDGTPGYFRIEADAARLTVDYHLGQPGSMMPRISARIVPGPVCELAASACIITLLAWRQASMDDTRWHRLCATHETEILLIKGQCETRWQARA